MTPVADTEPSAETDAAGRSGRPTFGQFDSHGGSRYMRTCPASVAGAWRASPWHRERRGVRLEPAKGEGSSSARALQAGAAPNSGVATGGTRLSSLGIRMDTEETSAMLLERIGGIFGQNLSNQLERFLVLDSTCRQHLGESGVVLLVESPYVNEVCYRYPLAGDAGIHVRDVLGKKANRLFPNEPIGRSVYDGHLDFLRLGIMNVNQLPFEEKPYVRYDNGVRQNQCW